MPQNMSDWLRSLYVPAGREKRKVEWEFACRAGTLTRTHFGENMSSRLANYDGNFPLPGSEKGPSLGRTVEVGLCIDM